MFDVGFWELFLTGLIALIVLGPERLPEVARTVGLWIGRARAAFYSVREEVEREINADGLRRTQRALQREIEEETRSVTKAVRITDATAERQTPSSQPPTEETAAAEHARESAGQTPSPRADGSAPPSSKDSLDANRGEADRTAGNMRQ